VFDRKVCECPRLGYVHPRLTTLTGHLAPAGAALKRGGTIGMKHTRSGLSRSAWFCLAATATLAQGCVPLPGWNGIFTIDTQGGAKTCVASTASPADGQSILVQMRVSNEGGWCGIIANRGGVAFESYLLMTRPAHGKVFAHHVATNTRIDYTPDPGFTGADGFTVRLIPGNAVLEAAVTVTK
jgi:hypothetical protein